ncbi:MAG: SDR family oxidoreductase [Bacteroidota bacterium]|nr:SDR family oxidoreductase [Bacteroidota bacterium]
MSVYSIRLDNKVIIVTGGYGYLGKAIVESLSFHGATVIVAARTIDKFNEELINVPSVDFVNFDISNADSIISGYNQVLEKYKKIDVIINNAFYLKGQSPETMTDEEWSYGIDGTLNSVFKTIRDIIPIFKNQGRGKIINVSSMYGVVAPEFSIYDEFPAFLNPPHYGAAKAAVIQLTKYYASYLGKLNVQVNAVTPGPFPSTSIQKNEGFMERLRSKTCLNKIGMPEDLAGIFTFLSSDAANFVTGQNFIVDGGWTVK